MERERDAEAELNLPPGFRFHPTDEELVVHYLRRKVGCQHLPVPIIADVDLYKYDPWQLPEKALFGQKEWYFFTPRDRKYPNGSRPNRAAGTGYWKATGADKLIRPMGSSIHVGIKKALVFYAGKAPKGIKTNWIMHEYRLTDPSHPIHKKGSLRLDDWVLCRLYNKKNNCKEVVPKIGAALTVETMDSFETVESRSPQSDVEHDSTQFNDLRIDEGGHPSQNMGKEQKVRSDATCSFQIGESLKEDNTWFNDLNLDDLQNNLAAFGNMPMPDYYQHLAYQDYYFSNLFSPTPKPSQMNLLPFEI